MKEKENVIKPVDGAIKSALNESWEYNYLLDRNPEDLRLVGLAQKTCFFFLRQMIRSI